MNAWWCESPELAIRSAAMSGSHGKNRHVAQRNVSVVTAGAGLSALIGALNKRRLFGTRLQLIQVSPKEGELVRHLAAPKLRLAKVDTHILGEINVAGEIVKVQPDRASAGMLAPVHDLAAGGAPAHPAVAAHGAVRVIRTDTLLTTTAAASQFADLFKSVGRLHPGVGTHPPPARGEAQVLRLATYSGDQLVGGYTMVVTGDGG